MHLFSFVFLLEVKQLQQVYWNDDRHDNLCLLLHVYLGCLFPVDFYSSSSSVFDSKPGFHSKTVLIPRKWGQSQRWINSSRGDSIEWETDTFLPRWETRKSSQWCMHSKSGNCICLKCICSTIIGKNNRETTDNQRKSRMMSPKNQWRIPLPMMNIFGERSSFESVIGDEDLLQSWQLDSSNPGMTEMIWWLPLVPQPPAVNSSLLAIDVAADTSLMMMKREEWFSGKTQVLNKLVLYSFFAQVSNSRGQNKGRNQNKKQTRNINRNRDGTSCLEVHFYFNQPFCGCSYLNKRMFAISQPDYDDLTLFVS